MSSTITATYANTTITNNGSSGSGLTYSTGTGINTTWSNAATYSAAGAVQAKDFIIDGVSIKQVLEERLGMLVPNPELEKEWEELKRLGDEYRKLEAECKEKSKMWNTLKK